MQISMGTFIAIACQGEVGAGAATNDVPPSHDYEGTSPNVGDLITGVAGTWSNADSIAHQWYRSGVAISGATSIDYTTVDADFGHTLTRRETAEPGSVTAESAATAAVAEVPVQSLGSELVTNGDMSSATGWTVGAQWAIGSGVATATNNTSSTLSQSILTANEFYEVGETVVHTSGGFMNKKLGSSATLRTVAASGTFLDIGWVLPADTRLQYFGSFAWNGTLDNVTAKKITRNAQLTAPSADMDIAQLYTLPGSPVAGCQIRLLLRISDLTAGNFIEARIEYTGTQWNVTLYTVAAWVRTSVASALNVGVTNGLRVNADGDQLSLYTTANSGALWTQRDTTKTNSTYQTATGVNTVHSSAITAGALTYAPA